MHILPHPDSSLRDAFDVKDLVDMATGVRPWTTLQTALASAKLTFAMGGKNSPLVRVFSIVLRADDEVQLISIGSRGGYRTEHIFGRA